MCDRRTLPLRMPMLAHEAGGFVALSRTLIMC